MPVPREIDRAIARTLKSISPIRGLANVVAVGTSGYRKLIAVGGVDSGWVSDSAPRPETRTPEFRELAPPMGELYANPAATQAMLDDAAFDVEGWLADEIAYEFAAAEGVAFVTGTGVNQPKGFLTAEISDLPDHLRGFGKLQTVSTGEAGGFDDGAPADALVRLVAALRSPYRQGAAWVMNASTLARIRTMKTADGAFLWQAGLAAGQPDTLMGYPVVEAEAMPDVADGATAVAFGNFAQGYLITERQETAILRDPFTNKPFVHFSTPPSGWAGCWPTPTRSSCCASLCRATHSSPERGGGPRSGGGVGPVGGRARAEPSGRTPPSRGGRRAPPPRSGGGFPNSSESTAMLTLAVSPPVPSPVTLAEAREWLGLSTPEDDATVARLLGAATGVAEGFLRCALIDRPVVERLPAAAAGARWVRSRSARSPP